MITYEPPEQQEVNVGDRIDGIGTIACPEETGTVMAPTEELRAMLDERGVEWKAPASYDGSTKYDTIVGDYWFHEYDGRITVHGLTPEQAIVATLGQEPDDDAMAKLHDRMNAALHKYERAQGIEMRDGDSEVVVPFVFDMHSLLNEAATLGPGTCQMVYLVETSDDLIESWYPFAVYLHREAAEDCAEALRTESDGVRSFAKVSELKVVDT